MCGGKIPIAEADWIKADQTLLWLTGKWYSI
jgi:hypothetical protein